MRGPIVGHTAPGSRPHLPSTLTGRMLRAAGARPVRLVPGRPHDRPIGTLDGLVLNGGEDLATALWRADDRGSPSLRDRFEWSLLEAAQARELPVLGICRGAQLINVHRGGTLVEDVSSLRPPGWRRRVLRPALDVALGSATLLARILAVRRLRVNCLHHQAVRDVGRGLLVAARDEFGIVQAIEGRDRRFLLGVQWHPELLPVSRASLRIFRAFVAAADQRSPMHLAS